MWQDVGVRVLFVCSRNACRSQMAEAMARSLGKGALTAASAGSHPGSLDPMTLEVLREAGFATRGLKPKSVRDMQPLGYDWIVTLCDEAQQSCPTLSGRRGQLHWPIDDPAAVVGDRAVRLQAYRAARDAIRKRLEGWLREAQKTL